VLVPELDARHTGDADDGNHREVDVLGHDHDGRGDRENRQRSREPGHGQEVVQREHAIDEDRAYQHHGDRHTGDEQTLVDGG
jgi:hypothetical protein